MEMRAMPGTQGMFGYVVDFSVILACLPSRSSQAPLCAGSQSGLRLAHSKLTLRNGGVAQRVEQLPNTPKPWVLSPALQTRGVVVGAWIPTVRRIRSLRSSSNT